MAEKLCTLRTKGGGGGAKQTETVLWTNSSPASSFSAQNVTISDSVDNYDYIAITYRASTSVADMATVVASVSDLKKSVGNNSTNHIAIHTGAQFSSGTIHARMVTYVNSTTIGFSLAYQLNAASSNAGWCIPTSIVGIKHMYGKMEHYATGYFSSGNTSVDLGFVPKYVFCSNGAPSATSANTTAQVYDANVSTTQYHMLGADVDEMRNIGTIGSANQFCMEGTVIGMNPNQNFSLFKNSKRYYWAIG